MHRAWAVGCTSNSTELLPAASLVCYSPGVMLVCVSSFAKMRGKGTLVLHGIMPVYHAIWRFIALCFMRSRFVFTYMRRVPSESVTRWWPHVTSDFLRKWWVLIVWQVQPVGAADAQWDSSRCTVRHKLKQVQAVRAADAHGGGKLSAASHDVHSQWIKACAEAFSELQQLGCLQLLKILQKTIRPGR